MLLHSSKDLFFQERQWFLNYLHASPDWPIGCIGDDGWETAKDLVNDTMGLGDLAPIIHLEPSHTTHRFVKEFDVPTSHTVFDGDAIILPKQGKWSVGMFVGDCAVVVIEGDKHIGYLHIGRKELTDSLVNTFNSYWPESPLYASVWIGPVISAMFYDMPDVMPILKAGMGEYLTPKSIWGTRGFSITCGIVDQLINNGISPVNFTEAEFCPYAANLAGHHEWASNQYRMKNCPGERSPRDFAWLHFDEAGAK